MSLRGSTDHRHISLAYLPPTPRQTRTAIAGAAVLLLGLAVIIPFAAQPLPKVNGFIPALDAIIFVTDLITAGLLLAHFSITRSRALRALGCGYLFSALIVAVHGLTFPGAFSETGNLWGSSHTNFRIYLLWHLGLPVSLFAYVWLRHKDRTKAGAHTPTEIVAICGVTVVLALASCIAWLALVPPVAPVAGRWLTVIIMLLCAAALAVLWAFQRSALDQWLMVVVLAMIVELAITALVGGRGPRMVTLGFYTGRLFSLVTSTVVLTALLAESTRLYARLARANMLASVVKATQALSSEILLPKLIERLMKIAIENAGADRGLLILPAVDDYLTQAVARATGDQIEVTVCQEPITRIACPETLVRHVIRTQESVVLDDASKPGAFSGDDYLRDRPTKSLLCLPLVNQRELAGILLLENASAANTFTPDRIAILELLAAQAAISLENTRLYSDLKARESELRRALAQLAEGQRLSRTGTFTADLQMDRHEWSEEYYRIFEIDPATTPSVGAVRERIHADDLELFDVEIQRGMEGGDADFIFRIVTPSRRLKYLRGVAHVIEHVAGRPIFMGTIQDITDLKHAEEDLRRNEAALRETQVELAHVARVTTMGELAASIAHEINQPIAGVVINGNTCLRWLSRIEGDSENLKEARETIQRTIRDGKRAGEIIARIRALFKKAELAMEPLDLNETIREIIVLARSEMDKHRVALCLELSSDLPSVPGDRVQLQQVMLNLILNAIEAMATVEERARGLIIRTQSHEEDEVVVTVQDSGTGIDPESLEHVFTAFRTSKPGGLGMGLSISRSIVENHSGRLWVEGHDGPGASFHFTLPIVSRDES